MMTGWKEANLFKGGHRSKLNRRTRCVKKNGTKSFDMLLCHFGEKTWILTANEHKVSNH